MFQLGKNVNKKNNGIFADPFKLLGLPRSQTPSTPSPGTGLNHLLDLWTHHQHTASDQREIIDDYECTKFPSDESGRKIVDNEAIERDVYDPANRRAGQLKWRVCWEQPAGLSAVTQYRQMVARRPLLNHDKVKRGHSIHFGLSVSDV